jgi:SAM-dependent methyltransferase
MKINLGSGQSPQAGYVNVDRFPPADVIHDLEAIPWPWDTSSVDEIRAHHILEHVGETAAGFIAIMREIYRVSKPGALIDIVFPYALHPSFFTDPEHVRPLMPETFRLFSKAYNRECAEEHKADSPLGLHYDVDFEPAGYEVRLDKEWAWILGREDWTQGRKWRYAERHVGAIKEIAVKLRVVKEEGN